MLPDSLEVGEAADALPRARRRRARVRGEPEPPGLPRASTESRASCTRSRAPPLAPDPGDEDAPAEGEGSGEDYLSVTGGRLRSSARGSACGSSPTWRSGPSPLWLKARLMAAGQRPINNVVDITNYVMLVLGQPMHAYDLDRLAGPALHVRRAREGERLKTLDGERARLRRRRRARLRRRVAPRASAGSWAAPRARCRRRRPGWRWRRRPGTAATSSRPRRSWGCAPRRARASRSSFIPSWRFGPSASRRG